MAVKPHLVPLKPPNAKKLIRHIFENGVVDFSSHALDEMRSDKLETTDCVNVLRGGNVEPPECVNNQWRYRVTTPRMCVVMTFISNDRLRVVTAWRNKQ